MLLGILFLVSAMVYSHDFIWGERLERIIEKNGSPAKYEDFKNDGGIIQIEYNYDTFKRIYTFANKNLVYITDEYGPYIDFNNAFDNTKAIINKFFALYTFEKQTTLGFNFKYGSDLVTIQFIPSGKIHSVTNEHTDVHIWFMYVSHLAKQLIRNTFE